ncbi:MAG: hypothetical protein R2789_13400 [Microthrixaceae bacterium]
MATEILVDSHVHVAGTDEVRYPRNPTGAGSDWWRRECGVENLRQEMDSVGVQRAVVVQAVGVYGYDCTYAAEVVAADPERLSLVVAIDMAGPDPLRALSELWQGHRWPVCACSEWVPPVRSGSPTAGVTRCGAEPPRTGS